MGRDRGMAWEGIGVRGGCLAGVEGRVLRLRVGLGWMGRVEEQGLGVDGVKAIGRDRAGLGYRWLKVGKCSIIYTAK